jgi:hypothetical protein
MKKECVLYDRDCINCGECDVCDLDPKKKCDNCGACLEMDDEYSTVDVDLSFEDESEPELLSYEELFPEKAFIGEKAEDEDDEFYDQDFEEDYGDEFDGVEFDDYDDLDEFSDDDNDLENDFGDLFG